MAASSSRMLQIARKTDRTADQTNTIQKNTIPRAIPDAYAIIYVK